MQPNHDPLKDLVRRYKTAIEPTPEHVEHERGRLLARIAAEPRPSGPPPRRARPVLLVTAIAAAVVLVWAGLRVYIDLRVQQAFDASLTIHRAQAPELREAIHGPGPARDAGDRTVPAPETRRDDEPIAVPPVPVSESPDGATVVPSSPAGSSAEDATAEPFAAAKRRRGAPAVDADELLRESALLSQAREAQSRGDWARVRELVDEHRRSHPHGALLEERLVLAAAAACNIDPRGRGQEAIQTLRRRFPRSLALARVSAMCDGTGDE
jgi:hypothetical protein